jgi:hypothetical protein
MPLRAKKWREMQELGSPAQCLFFFYSKGRGLPELHFSDRSGLGQQERVDFQLMVIFLDTSSVAQLHCLERLSN